MAAFLHVTPLNHALLFFLLSPAFCRRRCCYVRIVFLKNARGGVTTPLSQVVRFDRRVPMRQRWRAAGDNPAWRGFVPQWTAEGGAHRVWKRKTAERARLLHSFNEAVGASAEKPPELEAGKL